MLSSRRLGDRIVDALIAIFLAVAAAVCLMPIANTIAISFSGKAAAAAGQVYFAPVNPTLSSYGAILKDAQFFRSFGISIQRVLVGASLNVLLTILMAYPLSREKKQFRWRNVYMWIVVFTMLFNGGLIPLYIVVSRLGLIDRLWALILPIAVPAFNVILLMNFFRGIPNELEEAAIMDGAGPWTILAKVYVPVSLPAIATITLFSVVRHWNSFFDGLIYMNSPQKFPLQTYLQQLVVEISTLNLSDPDEIRRRAEISSRTLNSAKIVVAMVPVLVIYPFLQRYFIHGIVLGSVKG